MVFLKISLIKEEDKEFIESEIRKVLD